MNNSKCINNEDTEAKPPSDQFKFLMLSSSSLTLETSKKETRRIFKPINKRGCCPFHGWDRSKPSAPKNLAKLFKQKQQGIRNIMF